MMKMPDMGWWEGGEESHDPRELRAGRRGAGPGRVWGGSGGSRESRPERGAGSPDPRNFGAARGGRGGERLAPPFPLPRDPGRRGAGVRRPRGGAAPAPRPAGSAREPRRRPLTPAAGRRRVRGAARRGAAQEAEQEASPAAALSWGSSGRGGAASGAREPPPSRWGRCAAPSWGSPRAGVPARVSAFVSGARGSRAERLRGAARTPAALRPPARDRVRGKRRRSRPAKFSSLSRPGKKGGSSGGNE
ncbi:translation initiation factor IF-2-like [Dipodomys spectabilis]|uniref:translation initiation factor IF-2-like n=1 Tax=Dipodomys spectabilis TaxID=105255 RepID=UPI001C545841|nr:translation initiation factor IF-2-like [Dipodomys spectabilis]